eukprot:gene15401-16974_t
MCTKSELSSIRMESVEGSLLEISEIDSKEMDTFDLSHICNEESQRYSKKGLKTLKSNLQKVSKKDANSYLNYCGLIKKLAKYNERLRKIQLRKCRSEKFGIIRETAKACYVQ